MAGCRLRPHGCRSGGRDRSEVRTQAYLTLGDGSDGGRLARLYLAHAPASAKLARLLSESEAEATAAADAGFVRTVSLFRDLRSPLTFEAALRRAVIRQSRPSALTRLGLRSADPSPIESKAGDLWAVYSELGHRKKAALALRYFERLSDDQVADVLGCSTGAARTLVNRSLAELQGEPSSESAASRTAGELVRLFERRTDRSTGPVAPNPAVLKRASLGRGATVVGSAALAASAAVVGSAVMG